MLDIQTSANPTPVTSVNGWIVIQQRIDGSQSFDQNWDTYKLGFGTYYKNFWLGLEKMHQLTTSADYRLRFEVLINGDICDFLNHPNLDFVHNGMHFSAPDRDNDLYSNYSCAFDYSTGNWYNKCYYQRLNGVYGISFDYAYSPATYCRMMVKRNGQ
ncbi:hypothetical protein HELRODRAFT_86064 [Helobdella robusta]|uniref:Fibrinogen C-terminal domain-containing protein n=1 Tax=Helobdella robusta TaxID=6412 RepID=T1G668_HELRO|nr:hypothetical protein HELRODRAFT_86064 [Helobdella robusta]ESN96880.1 hypothetical protein HELRODRAFT_86064 [Helobdella robusta]